MVVVVATCGGVAITGFLQYSEGFFQHNAVQWSITLVKTVYSDLFGHAVSAKLVSIAGSLFHLEPFSAFTGHSYRRIELS